MTSKKWQGLPFGSFFWTIQNEFPEKRTLHIVPLRSEHSLTPHALRASPGPGLKGLRPAEPPLQAEAGAAALGRGALGAQQGPAAVGKFSWGPVGWILVGSRNQGTSTGVLGIRTPLGALG